jgi:hypothetical protein
MESRHLIRQGMRALRYALPVVVLLLLSACLGEEPKLKADTEANFISTYAAMTKDLNSTEKEKLDAALKDIVLIKTSLYSPTLAAKSYQIPSNGPGAAFAQNFGQALTNTMTKAIEVGVTAKWDENRARAVVQNAREIVDGKTANDILAIADSQRKQAIEAALAIYKEQLAKAKSALKDIETEAKENAQTLAEQKTLLDTIEITKPRFSYDTNGFLQKPTISFVIANKGRIPIKRIFVHGKVQTLGRAIPWVEADFNYEFPGGLEPGEKKDLSLAPNMFSDWAKVPKEAANSAVLSLTVIAFEDAAGKRIGGDAAKNDELVSRKKALEDGIKDLEHKISDLEGQLTHLQ